MPSPVGHLLFGFCIYLIVNKKFDIKSNWKEMLLYVFIATLSDLDELPNLFGIKINFLIHRTTFHSILFAFILAIIFSKFLRIRKTNNLAIKFLIFFTLLFSHPVLDLFMEDFKEPFGLMLLWPFSNNYYISPITIFPGVNHDNFLDLFSFHNLITVITEIIFFSIPIGIIFMFRKYLLKRTS